MGTRILSSKARQRNHDKYVLLFRSGKMTELDRKNYDLAMTWEEHGLVKPLPIRPWFVKPLQLFVVTLIIGILVWATYHSIFLDPFTTVVLTAEVLLWWVIARIIVAKM